MRGLFLFFVIAAGTLSYTYRETDLMEMTQAAGNCCRKENTRTETEQTVGI